MVSCKIIQNPEFFQLPSKWEEISPSLKGNPVDREGNPIDNTYLGLRYKIICKAQYTQTERIKRIVFAVLTIICTLGLAYFCSQKTKSLFHKKCKVFISPQEIENLKSISKTHEIGNQNLISKIEPQKTILELAQDALEKEIEISTKTLNNIKSLLPKIIKREEDPHFQFISRGQHFSVFTLDERPDLVFKIANDSKQGKEQIEKRYQNTIKGKQILMQYGLNLLAIPSSKILSFELNGTQYSMLVEKRLSFKPNRYEQEDLYYKNAKAMNSLIKQLARFIFEIGDDDVRFDNYPILDQVLDQPIQCGVIDLEFAGNQPIDGFIGDKHESIGLMGMMPTEELVDLLIEESEKFGLKLEKLFADTESIKAEQLKKIAKYHRFHQFCENRGITTGSEPFMQFEEIEKLGLDLDEKGQYRDKTYELRQAVQDMINEINRKIQKNKNSSHKKEKRHICINDKYPFGAYRNIGFTDEASNLEAEKQNWMNRILTAMRDQGYIFDFERQGWGYSIQC